MAAWDTLSIAQRSQLMNIYRGYGITSLSDMRRMYNESHPQLETSDAPVAPMYKGGGKLFYNGGEFPPQTVALEQVLEQKKREVEKVRDKNYTYHIDSRTDKYDNDRYYDVVGARYNGIVKAMSDAGYSAEEIERLAPFLTVQTVLEGGWRVNKGYDSRGGGNNNFGGMRGGEFGFQNFDTPEDFYNAYLTNLEDKWGDERLGNGKGWRNAQSLDDYARIIQHRDLDLRTKELYDEYNRQHPGNEVFIYTPLWENNYTDLMGKEKFGGIQARVNAYLDMYKKNNPIQVPKSRKAASTRPLREDRLYTHLNNRDERAFQEWYAKVAQVNHLSPNPNDAEHAYDYRGYWKNATSEERLSGFKEGWHGTDTYKWPSHSTFSVESKYYDPKTMEGVGYWDGETFIPGSFNALMKASYIPIDQLMQIVENNKEYAKGGKIHIKPENRGKFTALKKRTGHSASWFKAHGTPAQKKMAVFALNARKWKHSHGGIKF